jgi:uncharacterized protein (DUF1501 family)
MGGGVQGGRVFGRWPGLTREVLEGPGDLPVTTDYRDVLSELLERRLGSRTVGEVFPGFSRSPVGMFG